IDGRVELDNRGVSLLNLIKLLILLVLEDLFFRYWVNRRANWCSYKSKIICTKSSMDFCSTFNHDSSEKLVGSFDVKMNSQSN
ncbi:MAG TPA: hypothetical protein VNU45_17320, partial [Rummeliibacillus sp.]|nr:hypothetical protein [Rummeliibacillus sp.]